MLVIVAGWLAAGKGWLWLPVSVVAAVFGLAIAVMVVWSDACYGENSGGGACIPRGVPFPTEIACLAVLGLIAASQFFFFHDRENGGLWVAAGALGGLALGVAIDFFFGHSPPAQSWVLVDATASGLCWGLPVTAAAYMITRERGPATA